ncbi:MAG: DUF4870 domain-containing protein [Nanoarchaeota archaeon]
MPDKKMSDNKNNNLNSDQNVLGMLAHLLGLFTGFIGPLVLYIITKDKKGIANENAKHALNFQISLIIYCIISFILIFILIGIFLLWAISIFALVVEIIGAVRAYGGEVYKYPLEIGFIK